MFNKILFLLGLFLALTISPSLSLAQDPGMPDTVRLDSGELPAWSGRAKIPIYFTSDEHLA